MFTATLSELYYKDCVSLFRWPDKKLVYAYDLMMLVGITDLITVNFIQSVTIFHI